MLQNTSWPCTDLDQRLHRIKVGISAERKWPDAQTPRRIAEARLRYKKLKSGQWMIVRLTGEQYALLANILASFRPGRWLKIHPAPGVHFDLSQCDGKRHIDHLEFAPAELSRWRELLDACKLIGYDPDLCDGLYNRLKRKASQS